jgi:hypothetical protein
LEEAVLPGLNVEVCGTKNPSQGLDAYKREMA